jgi:hypothetical protein
MLYFKREEITKRPTQLLRFYSFADEGRRDGEMRTAYDTLSGKPEKMPIGIRKGSWENGPLKRM